MSVCWSRLRDNDNAFGLTDKVLVGTPTQMARICWGFHLIITLFSFLCPPIPYQPVQTHCGCHTCPEYWPVNSHHSLKFFFISLLQNSTIRQLKGLKVFTIKFSSIQDYVSFLIGVVMCRTSVMDNRQNLRLSLSSDLNCHIKDLCKGQQVQ